ncbi:hypothetical protein [Adhaeribacter soli]|uniref:Uncharacterized protein n=1 Tax=Adhaeribacter soli TaxID=2607655 RepID=A0A5N1IYH5_9BACT|nr:hypothetical protein [Adhaeribacter soli]KAA9333539.1 hypothetical protein F0P94_09775 [Adhaeribacter soli]
MGLDELFDKLKHEAKALVGEESKNKLFKAEREFETAEETKKHFPAAKERLYAINKWTEESGIKATFELYNEQLKPVPANPKVGYFMKIILPGVAIENWVEVTSLKEEENLTEFTVHPCSNPTNDDDKTQHFFVKETSSTFRVELKENKIWAAEIGKNETINNQEEAGYRSAVNTLIAEGGWAGVQKLLWQNLADYWCGLKEADKTS